MQSLKARIMNELGTGLSVATLCQKLGISYNELCKEAEDLELLKELKNWYPLYDFRVKKEVTANDIKNAVNALNSEPDKGQSISMLISKDTAEKMVEDAKPLETKEIPVKKKRTIKKKIV